MRTAVSKTPAAPTVTTATTPSPPSFDDLLLRLFANPNGGLLRLVAQSPSGRTHDWYFRRSAATAKVARWCWPPFSPAASGDVPAFVIARNADIEVRFSPVLYSAPATGAPARLTSVWAVLPVSGLPQAKGAYGRAIDPTSEREALARLEAVKPSPSIVLHSGFAITGIWVLRAPLADLVRAERLLWHLARKLNADLGAADPRAMTFGIPGTPMPGVFPTRAVTVMMLNDRDYTPEQL